MGRRIDGRFTATDDFNLDGHHIIGMTFLGDLPQGGAAIGETLVWSGDQWTPGAGSGSGGGPVDWDDVVNTPSEYPPEAHTQGWSTITGKPLFVNSIVAGTGIAVSGATGDVTITTSLVAGTFININGATIAVDSTSVAAAVHNHTIANVTDVGTNTQQFALNFIIDGIGAVLSQGDKGWVELNCDCVLNEFVVVCDTVGSMTLTVESATYAGHESGYSDVTGGADVTLTSDKKVRDSTLTGWTTVYSAGDFIKFGVGSASPANITRALLVMNFTKDWA